MPNWFAMANMANQKLVSSTMSRIDAKQFGKIRLLLLASSKQAVKSF